MLCNKQPCYLKDIKQKAYVKLMCLWVRWRSAALDWAYLGQLAGFILFHISLFSFGTVTWALHILHMAVVEIEEGKLKHACAHQCFKWGVTLHSLLFGWSKHFTWINPESTSKEIFSFSLLEELQSTWIQRVVENRGH